MGLLGILGVVAAFLTLNLIFFVATVGFLMKYFDLEPLLLIVKSLHIFYSFYFRLFPSKDADGKLVPSAGHQAICAIARRFRVEGDHPTDFSLRHAKNRNLGPLLLPRHKKTDFRIGKHNVRVLKIAAPGVAWQDSSAEPCILHFHSGGYVFGTPETALGVLIQMSILCGIRIYSIDYSLCPEASLQDQVSECVSVLEWLLEVREKTGGNSRIILVGDSAGAGLVLGTLQEIISRASNPAELQNQLAGVMMSPFVDWTLTTKSNTANANTDATLSRRMMHDFRKFCVPETADPADPKYSFVNGSYEFLPPLYLSASETEMLYDDSVKIYERAQKAGVAIYFESAPYGIHAYSFNIGLAPEYDYSFHKIISFIRTMTGREVPLGNLSQN